MMDASSPGSRRLTVRFFALLREQAGCSSWEGASSAPVPAALYAELQQVLPLTVPAAWLRVAINGRYATLQTPLQQGDQVVFLPPVAGG